MLYHIKPVCILMLGHNQNLWKDLDLFILKSKASGVHDVSDCPPVSLRALRRMSTTSETVDMSN